MNVPVVLDTNAIICLFRGESEDVKRAVMDENGQRLAVLRHGQRERLAWRDVLDDFVL